ncbi:KH domain-containing protein [Patescibacteria group bacterium]|nr:KH domain-containing protein [Patescibacteria group bacterium]
MHDTNAEAIENLQNVCTEVLKRMCVESTVNASIDINDQMEELIIINIESSDAHLLIGQGGRHLSALQHMLRMLARKENGESIQFLVDVNNYKKDRQKLLEQLARSSAEKVGRSGERMVLRPMPSYERRIIHQMLTGHPTVETESFGVEPERSVVIKPKTNS